MRTFSITQVERLCKTKAHTIRIWEKRYGFLSPERERGKMRYYSIDEMERIIYVSVLSRRGARISRLAQLDVSQLQRLCTQSPLVLPSSYLQTRLILSFYREEFEHFNEILEMASTSLGHEAMVTQVIVPFLESTDLLAYRANSVEIHFAVTALRQKLLAAIDRIDPAGTSTNKVVLFLPEGEHFDLILLCAYFKLKLQGYPVYYLGTNVSETTISAIAIKKHPDHVIMYADPMKKLRYENYYQILYEHLPAATFTIMTAIMPKERSIGRVKFTHFSELSLR